MGINKALDTDLPGYQWTQTQKSKNGAMARETKDLSSLITSQRGVREQQLPTIATLSPSQRPPRLRQLKPVKVT